MEAPETVVKAKKPRRAENIRLSNVIRRIMIRMQENPGALPDAALNPPAAEARCGKCEPCKVEGSFRCPGFTRKTGCMNLERSCKNISTVVPSLPSLKAWSLVNTVTPEGLRVDKEAKNKALDILMLAKMDLYGAKMSAGGGPCGPGPIQGSPGWSTGSADGGQAHRVGADG